MYIYIYAYSSEPMVHKKIRIPKDSAITIMEELGKLDDCVEFVDLNVGGFGPKKAFSELIERCENSIRRILQFESALERRKKSMIKYMNYQTFKIDLEVDMEN